MEKKKKCRCKKCVKFRKENSFEYLEVYALYHYLAKFLVDRLIALKQCTFSYPSELKSIKVWKKTIQSMVDGFECFLKDDIYSKTDEKKMKLALELLSKHFNDLWI